jgi:predicted phage tail protein
MTSAEVIDAAPWGTAVGSILCMCSVYTTGQISAALSVAGVVVCSAVLGALVVSYPTRGRSVGT